MLIGDLSVFVHMQEESEREEEKPCKSLVAPRDFRGTVDEVGESRRGRAGVLTSIYGNFSLEVCWGLVLKGAGRTETVKVRSITFQRQTAEVYSEMPTRD